MTTLSEQSRFGVPDDVVFREVSGESMILHLGTGIYFGLDQVGTRVWQLIVEHGALADVCAVMAEEFDAPAQKIREDVGVLLEQLVSKGLLRVDA